jgi:RNA polymerase sigma-70 factor (ECF subfamily)
VVRLVTLARAGDEPAREALVRRALGLAMQTASAVTGRRDAAADVAQDVGVDVLRGLGRLRDPASFDAWVHRITARRAIRAARANRVLRRREPPLESLGTDHHLLSVEDSPAASFDPALRRALLGLPPRQRLAVVLRYVHDMTEEGVAEALGCAPGTAASLLSRARAELRRTPELTHLFAAADETSRTT